MTNAIAVWLGLILIGAVLADIYLTGGTTLMAGARLFHEMILSLRFWN